MVVMESFAIAVAQSIELVLGRIHRGLFEPYHKGLIADAKRVARLCFGLFTFDHCRDRTGPLGILLLCD